MNIHESRETESTYCNGRECFEVRIRHRGGEYSQVYYCAEFRGYFDPFAFTERTCPKCTQIPTMTV